MSKHFKFLCVTLLSIVMTIGLTQKAQAQSLGTITTCSDVQTVTSNGISGGDAGFEGNSGGSYSGGGQSFSYNPSNHNFSYECAGVAINTASSPDIVWLDFDYEEDPNATEEENEEQQLAWYGLSTRDATRGRAAKNTPLFMDEHGICRKIDNTTAASALEPVFVGVGDYEEWQTVHGVPPGGDPNSGHTRVSGRTDLPAIARCCSPTTVTICGNSITTNYAEVGDVISLFGATGGFATLRCASNNNWAALSVHGICGSGNAGGGNTPSGAGMSNPSTGGTISQNEFDSLDQATQDNLTDTGYGPTDSVGTNAVGANDIAQAQADADAQAAAEAAEAQAEADRLAAEQAAQEAEEEAQQQDDD